MLSYGSKFHCLVSGDLASPFVTQLSHNFDSKRLQYCFRREPLPCCFFVEKLTGGNRPSSLSRRMAGKQGYEAMWRVCFQHFLASLVAQLSRAQGLGP